MHGGGADTRHIQNTPIIISTQQKHGVGSVPNKGTHCTVHMGHSHDRNHRLRSVHRGDLHNPVGAAMTLYEALIVWLILNELAVLVMIESKQ
jgi:hypothetical protein